MTKEKSEGERGETERIGKTVGKIKGKGTLER